MSSFTSRGSRFPSANGCARPSASMRSRSESGESVTLKNPFARHSATVLASTPSRVGGAACRRPESYTGVLVAPRSAPSEEVSRSWHGAS